MTVVLWKEIAYFEFTYAYKRNMNNIIIFIHLCTMKLIQLLTLHWFAFDKDCMKTSIGSGMPTIRIL